MLKLSNPLCLLITGAGAPGVAGTLHALRQNPEARPLRLVLVDANSKAVGRAWADAFYVVPKGGSEDYLLRMLEICSLEKVDLVLPQTTAEVARLSVSKSLFTDSGVIVVAADAAALALANDKHELLKLFAKLGLPHPLFKLCTSIEDLQYFSKAIGYPQNTFIVKPPLSNGMRGFRIISETRLSLNEFLNEKPSGDRLRLSELLEVLSDARAFPPLLATEYLPGAEYSVDGFIGSRARLAVPRLRRSIRSGISFDNDIEERKDLVDFTLRAADACGLTGAFGFQYKLDGSGLPKLLECNPRVQGTMVASVFAGVNIIWMAISEAIGNPLEAPTGKLKPATFQRYWGGVGSSGGQTTII